MEKHEELYEEHTDQEEFVRPTKKKGFWIVLISLLMAIVILVAALVLVMRYQPMKTVKSFLEASKTFDLGEMSRYVSGDDLAAISEDSFSESAFTDFFKDAGSKMVYKISDMEFNWSTAKVTTDITYFDGSPVFKDVISDYFKQVMNNAFAELEFTEDQSNQLLAEILTERSKEAVDQFEDVTITFECEQQGDHWVISNLDEDALNVVTANFTSVMAQMGESFGMEDPGQPQIETSEDVEEEVQQQEAAANTPPEAVEDDGDLELIGEEFTAKYYEHKVTTDFAGNPCLLVYYTYTNTGENAISPYINIYMKASQNGENLSAGYPEEPEAAIDRFIEDVAPGDTVTICQAFELKDMSEVALEISEAFAFDSQPDKLTISLQ